MHSEHPNYLQINGVVVEALSGIIVFFETTVTLIAERHKRAPRGRNGGSDGMKGTAEMIDADGRCHPCPVNSLHFPTANSCGLKRLVVEAGVAHRLPWIRNEDSISSDEYETALGNQMLR